MVFRGSELCSDETSPVADTRTHTDTQVVRRAADRKWTPKQRGELRGCAVSQQANNSGETMSCSLVEFGRLQELKTVRDFLFQSHNPDPVEENQQTGTASLPFSDDKWLISSVSEPAVLIAELEAGVSNSNRQRVQNV